MQHEEIPPGILSTWGLRFGESKCRRIRSGRCWLQQHCPNGTRGSQQPRCPSTEASQSGSCPCGLVSHCPCQICWVTVRAQPLSEILSVLLLELSRCQSDCQSCCQSSAAVTAAVRAAVSATVRGVVRAQMLSKLLSELLSVLLSELLSELSHCQLLSEQLSHMLSELSCCHNIKMKLIFTYRLAELIDNQEYQRESLEESMAALGITMETRTFKQLHNPTQLQPHQICAVNWIADNEKSIGKGGLFADNCGTGMVRPCCAVDRLFATLTIIRLWHRCL